MLTVKWKSWSIAACASLTAACASFEPPSTGRSILDASLTEPCPPLSPPADGTGASVLRWALATVDAYHDCAASKRRLAEAVR